MSLSTSSQVAKSIDYLADAPVAARARQITSQFATEPLVVVTDTAAAAAEMYDALKFFLNPADRDKLQFFGDYETLPYDVFSPSAEVVSERQRALYRVLRGDNLITVTSITALLQKLPPKSYLTGHALLLEVGERIEPEKLRNTLVEAGYQKVEAVRERGQFSVRGSIIDLYPSGAPLPCRIDFFDDEVQSLRLFEPDTQLTIEKVSSIDLLPAREFPLDENAIRNFRNRWLKQFEGDPRNSSVYESIRRGRAAQGVESYLPLFFDEMQSFFDYLPDSTCLYLTKSLPATVENLWREIQHRFEQYSGNIEQPLLPPTELYQSASEIFAQVKNYRRKQWRAEQVSDETKALPDVALHFRTEDPYANAQSLIDNHSRVLICAETPGRREVLLDTLAKGQLKPDVFDSWHEFLTASAPLGICLGNFPQGCIFTTDDLALVAENDLLTEKVASQHQNRAQRKRQQAESEQIIRNLTELRAGAPVVHIDHGVGRFMGLETLKVEGGADEFLALQYADNNKLYVPVHSLELISRYTGADAEHAPLNRLGSDQWEKAKRKAKEKIRDTAAELLDVYAKRQAKAGFSNKPNQEDYLRFCQEFAFEETDDQLDCLTAVEADMRSSQPMDRLICGDVGFGKTEIALRAAFISVSAGKQVLVLVPTTLLARQHLDTFRDRFANWPVKVDAVSRLKTADQQNTTLETFAKGDLDILIGTHKLIHAAVETKNLGLLVVDEEHRFGVRQKEKLKSLKADVDILTLTATPIPRTLNMAMASIRDLSIIATPPARRLAVKTFVRQDDNRTLEEALRRELMRGGQVYLLHNEIRSIERRAEDVRRLVPDARVAVAHGQMREQQLENIVTDFYHQRFDVLVCTTIIETGIDIPSANTIIIDRADKFGLAQLHQLRGRVGRSHHQAYAYLLTVDSALLTADAEKRLDAIQEADHLGCGFTLATHDLEIRGAGELLGEQQSGQIHAIGFELFQQMLAKAVRQLQAGEKPLANETDELAVDIQLGLAALIPDDYLSDVNTRLQLYKRIASAETNADLEQLQIEMIDRFGLLPEPCKNLFRVTAMKSLAREIGINKITCNDHQGMFQFIEQPNIDPVKLIGLVQSDPQRYRFQGASRLQFTDDLSDPSQLLRYVEDLLAKLAPQAN